MPFSAQLAADETEAAHTRAAIAYLKRPATRIWVAGRVAALLSHYFVAQQDDGIAAAVAEDWCATLATYPAWSIANACRWWMSRENPRKHLKPLPGDIEDRAHAEMEPIRAARITLRRGISGPVANPMTMDDETSHEYPAAVDCSEAKEKRRLEAEAIMDRFRTPRSAAE